MIEATLLFHLIGFGLLMTALVGGIIVHRQYRKAPDLRTGAMILRAGRPFGLMSPVALLILLLTGIGNMHAIRADLFTYGWLSTKIALFAFAAVAGTLLGVIARRRGQLVQAMSVGDPGSDGEARLRSYDRILAGGQGLLALLLLGILYLTVTRTPEGL